MTGRAATYANEFRDVRASAGWQGEEARAHLSLLTQPAEVGNHVMATDGLVYLAGPIKPYYEAGLDGGWDLTRQFTLEPGVTVRELYDPAEAGNFNHAWQRYYVGGTLRDGLAKDSTLTITPSVWNGDDTVASLEGSYRQPLTRDLSAAVGVDFSRYRYDWDDSREVENVVGASSSLTWEIVRRLTGKLSYRIENDEFETYHAITTSLTYRF